MYIRQSFKLLTLINARVLISYLFTEITPVHRALKAQIMKNGAVKATVPATKETLAMTKECADGDALAVALVDLKNHVVATVIGTRLHT